MAIQKLSHLSIHSGSGVVISAMALLAMLVLVYRVTAWNMHYALSYSVMSPVMRYRTKMDLMALKLEK